MSFFKKNKKTSVQEETLLKLEEQSGRLLDLYQSGKEEEEARSRELLDKINRHDMAIENLLDILEENEEENRSRNEREQEYKAEKKRMLELFDTSLELTWQMCRFLWAKEEEWGKQADLVWQELAGKMVRCGFSPVFRQNEPVDYELHEVVNVVPTEDASLDKKVAQVYSPGYVYQGKLTKKAKISAYQSGISSAGH